MQTHEQIAKGIGELSEMVIRRALEQQKSSFETFREEVEKKVNGMIFNRPVLSVKINDEPEKKLKSRASAQLPRLITNAKLGLYTLMVGPAGCGKTTAAAQLAEALGLQFGSVCLTAGASETWLFGRQTPTGFVEGMFSKIYREGGVFLADEMDAADANLLLSINTALSHNSMLNPMNGAVIPKHENFIFVAAANTNGKGSTHTYTGRSRLDAAALDRMVLVAIDYDKDLEKDLCPDDKLYNCLQEIRENLKKQNFDEFVSTRAFVSTQKQYKAGVTLEEIRDSLMGNWSDHAKEIARSAFRSFEEPKERAKGKKREPVAKIDRIPDNLTADELLKWKPGDEIPF